MQNEVELLIQEVNKQIVNNKYQNMSREELYELLLTKHAELHQSLMDRNTELSKYINSEIVTISVQLIYFEEHYIN